MRGLFVVAMLAAAAVSAQAPGPKIPADDVILRAMRDELDRSRALRVAALEDRPYYIEYELEDVNTFSISASLGALINVSAGHGRAPSLSVRVGGYDFDNTNHVLTGRFSGSRFDQERWPLDNNYAALRHNLWLATDRAYKGALESIARKRSSLRNTAARDTTADFSKAEPVNLILPVNRGSADEAVWKKRTIGLSHIFNSYPEIFSSGVDMSAYIGTSYMLTSEGTVQRVPEDLLSLTARAQAQAADGMQVHDSVFFQSLAIEGLPSELDLTRGITQVADNVRALLKAPPGEAYSGPVLFEARAAAQLFAQVLGDNVKVSRRPVTDPGGRTPPQVVSELESKIGSRILPEWMDVVDDPTQKEWRGRPLVGFYHTDMEGVAGAPVQIVEKGVFKNFLLTRTPVKGVPAASNGHARLSGNYGARSAAISNMFVRASQTKPLADLKKQLIEMCQQRNKPYGILIRKLDYPSTASLQELRSLVAAPNGGLRAVSPPALAYRVYPDGREELIRGLRFRGVSTRSLRDITAASDENAAFDFINNGAPFAFSGLGGYLAPATVLSPSLLFEEMELEVPQEERSKPPLVPPPPFESATR